MGSTFSRYKTPALVNLDFHPTFTATLLRKDFDLGLAAAREREVPLPVAALVHQLVQAWSAGATATRTSPTCCRCRPTRPASLWSARTWRCRTAWSPIAAAGALDSQGGSSVSMNPLIIPKGGPG